jgi:hypothetical protein
MFDQMLDSFRKATESTLQIQQDMFKTWTQQLFAAPPTAAGASTEWGRSFQKRWIELTIEFLNKHRESLDNLYKAGIEVMEQSFRVSDAKSPEDYRRIAEDVWRKLFDTFKAQYETQFHDFQEWTEKSFEMSQRAQS